MGLEHREILEVFNEDWEADRDNREDAYDDLHFLAGDQWDGRAKAERFLARRPMVTINKMGQFVRQVTGDMRLNPIGINVLPVDDESDVDKAEIFEGLIRQIEYASNATNAYAHAFECSAGVGIGHFRINTRYAQDSVSDQECIIERIMNPLAVVWDAGAIMIDRSDALHCFVTDLIPSRVFKKKYPDASLEDFPRNDLNANIYWRSGDMVRVAEFWVKEPYQRTLATLGDGSTVDITGVKKRDKAFLGIVSERTFTDYRVRQYIVSGSEILKGPNEWAGRHIPIIPAIGSEIPLDETVVRHGIIRPAKDPQRMYNYMRSAQAEIIGQQPRSPFILTVEQIKGHEALWNTANTNPRPWLPYNADPKAPGAPQRLAPPVASEAMWAEAQIANDDMKATTGIYDASLGARSNETSGRAIMARQREGDVGSYHYFDNFKAAILRAGEILLDLIPKIYDAPRTIRIIGAEEGEPAYKPINQPAYDPNQMVETVLNDLSVGKFDVRVSAGPSFSTRREEAREGMLAATQANPMLWQIAGDLLVKAFDWPYAKEISERLKRTIPPNVTGDEEAMKAQQPPPDPIAEELKKMAVAEAEATVEEKLAKVDKMVAETEKIEAETATIPVKTAIEVDKAADGHERVGFDMARAVDDMDFRERQGALNGQPD